MLNDSLAYLLKALLKSNKINIDYEELEFQLLSHPSYPSLHAVTGVLKHFNISHLALEVPQDAETLAQLPTSFLAHVKDKGEDFVLVTANDNHYTLLFEKNKRKTLSADEFISVWSGVVVVVEKDEEVLESKSKSANISRILSSVAVFTLLAVFFYNLQAPFPATHFTLSIIGLFISAMLVKYEMGLKPAALEKFCSKQSEKVSCDAVLHSKGATVFGNKLSYLCAIYFSVLSASWILISVTDSSYNSMVIITALSIPVCFYSIIYQLAVIKKWCTICLSIVGILVLQVVAVFYLAEFIISGFRLDASDFLLPAVSLLLAIPVWQFIMTQLKQEQELKKLKIDHSKFKRSYNLFKTLLFRTDPVSAFASTGQEIIYGNTSDNPLLQVIIITNPLCGHCKSAHEVAEKLLQRNSEGLQVIVRFNVHPDNPEDPATRIAARLLEIYHRQGAQPSLEAMHEVYGGENPTSWLEQQEPGHDPAHVNTLRLEKAWCQENGINFTPQILVNGRAFPEEYERGDLLHFIDDILEDEDYNSEVNYQYESTV